MINFPPYYSADKFTLLLGDSTEVLESIDDNSIDMIFADPPYNLSNDGFTCHSGKRVSVNKGAWDKSEGIESDFEFHEKWINLSKNVLKENGTIWISGTYHSIYACGFALQKSGFKILNDITWFKPNAAPNLSGRYFTASHETLLWAIKNPNEKHTFNYDLMKNGNWINDKLKAPNKQMRSVWSIGTPRNNEKKFGKHPTQKPLDLLKRIVLASTNKNDIVLDPFSGSSTTGIACTILDREFIGIDQNEEYLQLSIKRYEDLSGAKEQENLFAINK